jgi:hypothetical protein
MSKVVPGWVVVGWLACFIGSATAGANSLNRVFGIPIWDGSNLWADNAADAAKRLKLEGSGPVYQKFFAGDTVSTETTITQSELGPQSGTQRTIETDETKVLGAKAYAIQLYEKNGKVDEVIINFANRADIERTVKSELAARELAAEYEAYRKKKSAAPFFDTLPDERRLELNNKIALEVEQRLGDAKVKDLAAVGQALTRQFGKSDGAGTDKEIWQEMRHEFLLLQSRDGFSLKIQKTGSAKADAKPPTPYQLAQIRADLPAHVDRRSGGDIVITGIPNISQGARNYCTTATWQKVLRYYGFSPDIFELAEKGGTTTSGSEGSQFAAKMSVNLKQQGMQVDYIKGTADNLNAYRTYLDRGVPVIWNMDSRYFPAWYTRSKERKRSLNGKDITVKDLAKLGLPGDAAPHTLLIIGYNNAAREIALSDSTELGQGEPEIWVRLSEAGLAHKEFGGSQLLAVVPSGKGGAGGSLPPTYTNPDGKKYY